MRRPFRSCDAMEQVSDLARPPEIRAARRARHCARPLSTSSPLGLRRVGKAMAGINRQGRLGTRHRLLESRPGRWNKLIPETVNPRMELVYVEVAPLKTAPHRSFAAVCSRSVVLHHAGILEQIVFRGWFPAPWVLLFLAPGSGVAACRFRYVDWAFLHCDFSNA